MLVEFLYKSGLGTTASAVIGILVCALVSYLLGSLNFGIIFSKLLYKEDVRSSGSGNAGSTNMLRTYGKRAAFMTFGCDCLKTAISIGIGFLIFDIYGMFIAGIACMVGHTYPVFFKFKGGKGVACFAILVLITSITMKMWYLFVILFAIFIIIVIGTRFVSLGSIICALLYPILLNRFVEMAAGAVQDEAMAESIRNIHGYEIYAVVAAFFVVFLHRSNLVRLFTGNENKISFSKKKKEDGESK